MARSFRCSWGSRGEVAYCRKLIAFPNTFESNPSYAIVSIALFSQINQKTVAIPRDVTDCVIQLSCTTNVLLFRALLRQHYKMATPTNWTTEMTSVQQYCTLIDHDRDSHSPKVERHIVKLYAEQPVALCNVLSPTGLLRGTYAYLDYEMSWHLNSILRTLEYQLNYAWEFHLY
ncbi:unnamed protein product [Albugo candida]|uniref:Uncharacterized protein n=1 Tax=Albugo candida TaxID=65357 RepID=A0A024FU55_9STRA|nr:unnamed protein product [Albugo candida]|eukprot:CCI10546.1 unnamed protein product [Albugo candida]